MIEFSVFYIVFSFCFVFPPSAFISAGLTVPSIFDSWLGSEDVQFVTYQFRRALATIMVHSLLPLGYFGGLVLTAGLSVLVALLQNPLWKIILGFSVMLPAWAAVKVALWWISDWQTHPLIKCLASYADSGRHWTDVASEINTEFRRIDKVIARTNAVSKTVITNSWIIKVEPYSIFAAHQNHVSLQLENAEDYNLTADSQTAQYLTVHVEHFQTKKLLFTIRLNAIDYADIQDRLQRPISNVRGLAINQDIHARFSKVFVEEVRLNPIFQTREETDSCLGCAVNKANVRLIRRCSSVSDDGCTPCFCRPMWCISCLSRWFSSRQDSEHPETWLSSRCPCPTCRSPFCILDISLIEHVEDI